MALLGAVGVSLTTVASADPVAVDITGPDGAKLTGDPVAGEKVFKQCQTCHTLEPGKNKVGPTLHGIIGRTAGTVEGYNYSKANKESGRVWTEQAMFDYLENPRAEGKGIPGTKMSFVGLKKPEDRANVIAYIQEADKPATGDAAPAP
jgi:cytochrome c